MVIHTGQDYIDGFNASLKAFLARPPMTAITCAEDALYVMKKHDEMAANFWNSSNAKEAKEAIDASMTEDVLFLMNEDKFLTRKVVAATWCPGVAYVTKNRTTNVLRQWNANCISFSSSTLLQCIDGKEF